MVSRFDRRGMRFVSGSNDQPKSPFFRVYEDVPYSGVYRVFHSAHRASHDVILRTGEVFPRCNKCGEDVHFELIQPVSGIRSDSDFGNIRVYEIPHPELCEVAAEDDQQSGPGEEQPEAWEKKTA